MTTHQTIVLVPFTSDTMNHATSGESRMERHQMYEKKMQFTRLIPIV